MFPLTSTPPPHTHTHKHTSIYAPHTHTCICIVLESQWRTVAKGYCSASVFQYFCGESALNECQMLWWLGWIQCTHLSVYPFLVFEKCDLFVSCLYHIVLVDSHFLFTYVDILFACFVNILFICLCWHFVYFFMLTFCLLLYVDTLFTSLCWHFVYFFMLTFCLFLHVNTLFTCLCWHFVNWLCSHFIYLFVLTFC